MKPGTPGFVGARLREGRAARGLPAITLAELIGVTRAAVSQYESGLGTPRPEVMQRICQVLNLPAPFFSCPTEEMERPTIFYRSMSTATKGARQRVEGRFLWLRRDIVPYLRQFVEFPHVNLPGFDLPPTPSAISTEEIEWAATETRRYWGLGDGPISNVVWLLENNGAVVTRGEIGADTLDSFSSWVDGVPYIFLGSDKAAAARSRFDAAHELGHLILHRNVTDVQLKRASDYRLIEDQAHRFAGAFLLPASTFSDEVHMPTLYAFRALKPKWVVSIGAMIKRTEDLGLISPDQPRRLWIAYSRRGWRRREPLDDELPLEEPRLQRDAFELIFEQGVQTRDDVLTCLPYAPTDIEELAVLERGRLTESPSPVRLIPSVQDQSPARANLGDGGADIIPFPTKKGSGD